MDTGAYTSSEHGADSRKIFPLSKLAESISKQIEATFSGAYWITAEITKLNHYPQSGHCYPQLTEKREGRIVADFRGFILKARYLALNAAFMKSAGRPLSDGMQILFRCKVGYHPIYGLSLNILDIEPAFTLGEMARMRSEALKKLKTDGDYDRNKKLQAPALLRRIAVISVETSKGYRDFESVIEESPYAGAVRTDLFPALLQGDAAVDSISAALEKIASRAGEAGFDAVCIIRGGGGETGLDCYDAYALALRVARFPLPVITGIGHVGNYTLTEQVAHRNLITPTALARHILEGFEAFEARIKSAEDALRGLKRNLLRVKGSETAEITARLKSALGARANREQTALRATGRRFETAAKKALEKNREAVTYRLPARLKKGTESLLRKQEQRRENYPPALSAAVKTFRTGQRHALDLFSEKVQLLDPANALKRGYSITTLNGKPVTDAAQLSKGDVTETRFAKGSARSTVNDIET